MFINFLLFFEISSLAALINDAVWSVFLSVVNGDSFSEIWGKIRGGDGNIAHECSSVANALILTILENDNIWSFSNCMLYLVVLAIGYAVASWIFYDKLKRF